MSDIHIKGKIKFKESWRTGETEWEIVEHEGMFKPLGVIKLRMDKQATLDFSKHEFMKDKMAQELDGKTVHIIIH